MVNDVLNKFPGLVRKPNLNILGFDEHHGSKGGRHDEDYLGEQDLKSITPKLNAE